MTISRHLLLLLAATTCIPVWLAAQSSPSLAATPQADRPPSEGGATSAVRPGPTAPASATAKAGPPAPDGRRDALDVAHPPGLPAIGWWMIAPDGSAAHWLGETIRGRHLHEPINLLIVDRGATSPEHAVARVEAALAKAGYPARIGHSNGYRALIGDSLRPQVPGTGHTFSDEPFEINNNHGRVFGPVPIGPGGVAGAGRAFLFTAAFSRESVDPLGAIRHRYASFNRARDDIAQRLDDLTHYGIAGFVNLDNALIGDPETSTGDHDGIAVLVVATR